MFLRCRNEQKWKGQIQNPVWPFSHSVLRRCLFIMEQQWHLLAVSCSTTVSWDEQIQEKDTRRAAVFAAGGILWLINHIGLLWFSFIPPCCLKTFKYLPLCSLSHYNRSSQRMSSSLNCCSELLNLKVRGHTEGLFTCKHRTPSQGSRSRRPGTDSRTRGWRGSSLLRCCCGGGWWCQRGCWSSATAVCSPTLERINDVISHSR